MREIWRGEIVAACGTVGARRFEPEWLRAGNYHMLLEKLQ